MKKNSPSKRIDLNKNKILIDGIEKQSRLYIIKGWFLKGVQISINDCKAFKENVKIYIRKRNNPIYEQFSHLNKINKCNNNSLTMVDLSGFEYIRIEAIENNKANISIRIETDKFDFNFLWFSFYLVQTTLGVLIFIYYAYSTLR
jgi:hypothetical protein